MISVTSSVADVGAPEGADSFILKYKISENRPAGVAAKPNPLRFNLACRKYTPDLI